MKADQKFPFYLTRASWRHTTPGGHWRDHDSIANVKRSIRANGGYVTDVIQVNEDGTWDRLDPDEVVNANG